MSSVAPESLRSLRRTLGVRLNRGLTAVFHRRYYDSNVWSNTHWMGVEAFKCPLDLWIYQEILAETRPKLIVETGTNQGGSALFLASVCELFQHGHVVTIDIVEAERLIHPRITYLHGSSTDDAVLNEVRDMVNGTTGGVMVVLDSDHTAAHVLAELEAYAPFVTPGCYLIVEDTNVNGHPVRPDHGPGPAEAVEQFLAANDSFQPDPSREKFFLTFNPGGYLRRS